MNLTSPKFQILPNETNKKRHYSHAIYTAGKKVLLGWTDNTNHYLAVNACLGMVVVGNTNIINTITKQIQNLELEEKNQRGRYLRKVMRKLKKSVK